MLPIDPTRTRKEMSADSDQYVALSDEMQRASSCREAVDLIVTRIQDACEDMGGGHGKFVTEEDVVRFESNLFLSVDMFQIVFCVAALRTLDGLLVCMRRWNMG